MTMSKKLKDLAKNAFWKVYGIRIANPALPQRVNSILFVCAGNICRSPFAERTARRILGSRDAICVASAGIQVTAGGMPPENAVDAARDFGIDLTGHFPRQISYDMVASHDMVVSMEAWQHLGLGKLFAEFSEKCFLLPLFDRHGERGAYDRYNVQDPYGRSRDEFAKCYHCIHQDIENMLADLGVNG